MNEGVETAFQLMKDRIRSTHVHDNDGKSDLHLFPLENEGGTIDWKSTMHLLRGGEDQFPLLLELKEKPGVAQSARNHQPDFPKLGRTVAARPSPRVRSRYARKNHYRRSRPARRRNRRDPRLALQPAPFRKDRVPDPARRLRPDAMRGGEDPLYPRSCSKPSRT